MRIDLHTHSAVSDGTAPPAQLVREAAAAGLDVVAITDHDTTHGWDEAAAAAAEVGVDLVRGIEVSTTHRGRGVHLLAYLPDPGWPPLAALLGRIRAGRDERIPTMLERLNGAGVVIGRGDLDDGGPPAASIGRPHVADALVRLGAAVDRDDAFRRFLAPGRPGYVGHWAAPLEQAVRVVQEAGGATVVAHPWGRHGPAGLDEETIAALAAQGLTGLEVDHQDHDGPTRDRLRRIATDLDLVVTGSSDHHGTGKVDHELGCHTTDAAQYARLLERAEAAAAACRAAGGSPVGVVGGRAGGC